VSRVFLGNYTPNLLVPRFTHLSAVKTDEIPANNWSFPGKIPSTDNQRPYGTPYRLALLGGAWLAGQCLSTPHPSKTYPPLSEPAKKRWTRNWQFMPEGVQPHSRMQAPGSSAPFAKAITQEIVQFRDLVNLADCLLERIFYAAEGHMVVV